MDDELTDNISSPADHYGYEKDLPIGDKAEHNSNIRKRIDELHEQKRLKQLLADWDI